MIALSSLLTGPAVAAALYYMQRGAVRQDGKRRGRGAEERVQKLEGAAEEVKQRLAAFRSEPGPLGEALEKEIASGLDSCKTEESGFYD